VASVKPRGEAASGGAVSAEPRKLVFVGFMGAGKTPAARRAAALAGAEAVDSDELLEASLGEPIESYFERHGEAVFREREEAVVLDLLERPGAEVVALGGGALGSDRVRQRLAEHVVVYLDVDSELAWARASESGRPLARERDAFRRLHERRRPGYEAAARATLPALAASSPAALAAAVALTGPGVPASLRMRWALASTGGYPVYLGEGALAAAAELWPAGGRAFAVADARALELHGERLRAAFGERLAGVVEVAPGEIHKTLAEAGRVLGALAETGMERADTLVAFGGGVTGDLGGFCAAVYQRGVALVQVPTTLVAQVDSAYGGKTGVDLPQAKNYVGALHQPAAVLADLAVLSTLPAEELRAGFAEVLKTGLIAGDPLWSRVRALPPVARAAEEDRGSLAEVIEGCVEAKVAIVGRDERDRGERASLNLGHTFAHALEAASGYAGYRHGEAVALGLLVALRLSEQEVSLDPSLREEVEALLERHGLPTSFSGPATRELLGRAALDKKRRGGAHRFVLLSAPGAVSLDHEVTSDALGAAIEEIRR
jgi:shikimate kinase / 3-dehydroquinate synthase